MSHGRANFETCLERERPDLIVLDVSLGDTDAVELIRLLQARGSRAPLAILSGWDERTVREVANIAVAYGLDMRAILTKPLRPQALREVLDAIVPPSARAALPRIDFREAHANGWLTTVYQPKIDLKERRLCGAEALVRVRHPQHGVLAPSCFLPEAGTPEMHALTRYMLERAMQDWLRIARAQLRCPISVNASLSCLASVPIARIIRKAQEAHPNWPGMTIEISEGEIINDPALVRETALQLRVNNVAIAVDDFGAAFSSLARLKEIDFSELKVDRSLVHNCHGAEKSREMMGGIVDLAHRLGATCTAEGVETLDEVDLLTEVGCDAAQGYLFCKPIPAEDLIKLALSMKGRPRTAGASAPVGAAAAPA